MVKTRSQASDETKGVTHFVGTGSVSQVGTSSGPSSAALPNGSARKGATQKGDTNRVSNQGTIPRKASATPTGTHKQTRIKWTQEINQFIMRSYYECTDLETDLTNYRSKIYQKFRERYPRCK